MKFTIFIVVEYLKEMYFWSDQWIQALDFEVKETLKAIVAKIESKMYVYLCIICRIMMMMNQCVCDECFQTNQ